jgi:hypothetical protein
MYGMIGSRAGEHTEEGAQGWWDQGWRASIRGPGPPTRGEDQGRRWGQGWRGSIRRPGPLAKATGPVHGSAGLVPAPVAEQLRHLRRRVREAPAERPKPVDMRVRVRQEYLRGEERRGEERGWDGDGMGWG